MNLNQWQKWTWPSDWFDKQMVWEWFKNDLRMIYEWFKNDLWMSYEWILNDLWMISEWFLNDLRMNYEWFTKDLLWTDENILNCYEYDLKFVSFDFWIKKLDFVFWFLLSNWSLILKTGWSKATMPMWRMYGSWIHPSFIVI